MSWSVMRASLLKATLKSTVSSTAHSRKKPLDDVQIVVIGAGLAGLSAASHLLAHGFRSTILLEASERCGGRINSKQFGDVYCELGAKWIPIDGTQYSMYELLSQNSGLQKEIQPHGEAVYVNTANGLKVNSKLPELVDSLFKKLYTSLELQQKLDSGNVQDLNNVHAYFSAQTEQLLRTIFPKDQQQQAHEIFHSLFKEFSSLLGCCLEYLNIEHLTSSRNMHASPIYIPTGLDNLLQQLVTNIDVHQIKMGKPVGEIRWLSTHPDDAAFFVGCLDGSAFQADHVICTLPLGVLKHFAEHIFRPALPKQKQQAIDRLGFGSPVKIYLEYKENVTPWFSNNIRPLWQQTLQQQVLIWPQQIVEIAKLPTSSRVLELLIGGAYYSEIEKLPDDELQNEVTQLMRNCLRNPMVPHPTAVLRSNWSSSACYLGGRPYYSTESSAKDVRTLSAPLGDRPSLLFAGDATIVSGFGTMDGARKSGIREAERIVDFYKRLPL